MHQKPRSKPGNNKGKFTPKRREDRDTSPERERNKGNKPNAFRKRSLTSRTNSRAGTSVKKSTMRLNKYIAHAGICSRRDADELIRAGLIQVNGKVISEMGYQVKPSDLVKYNGETIRSERKVYLLLNKPKNYITTLEDTHGRKTVMQLVHRACKERIYPVGRLDRATTGLLLFTNDGDMAKRLSHPKHRVKKTYHVQLNKKLTQRDLDSIAEGVKLEDGPAMVDVISYIPGAPKDQVGVELHLGRNRIVRRIFESLGYEVVKLDRVYFAGLTKKNLSRGQWRFLTDKEIDFLKMV